MRSNAKLPLAALVAAAITITAAGAGSPAQKPERIVSLVPSVTEILFALGAGNQVVGVSQYDDYPPAVRALPRVGSFLTPNVEAIVGLRPTLVVGRGISSNQREFRAMRAMGIDVLVVEDDTLAQIEQSIRTVGARLNMNSAADSVVGRIESSIATVRERLDQTPRRRVLMIVGHQPMVAVGTGNFLDDLIKLARGDNIAEQSGEAWTHMSIEYAIAMRPEVILDGAMGNDPAAPTRFWDRFPSVPAVRNHRVYGYPQDRTLHPGPRVGQTLEMLAAMIHPEAWDRAAAPSHQGDSR